MSTQATESDWSEYPIASGERPSPVGLADQTGGGAPDPGRRLSLHLKGNMAALVRLLAARTGMKVSDVVKASIASFEFLDEHARRGEQIFIEDSKGRMLKVAWPPRSPQ